MRIPEVSLLTVLAIFLVVMTAFVPVRAQTNIIEADHAGNCVWDGTHDVSPCIQIAINAAAQNGGVVHIPHGTWPLSQALIMANNMTLESDKDGTVLKPQEDNTSKPVLLLGKVKTTNVLIKNIAFDGGGQDFANDSPVIMVTNATNIVFDDITVQNTHGMGLLLQGGIKSSGVRNSHFVNIGNHWRTTGQRTDRIQGLTFCCGQGNENNFATGNHFEDIGLDALQISDQNGFIATDNVFDLEGDQFNRIKSADYPAAIFPLQSTNVEMTHNTIRNAPGNGIDAPGLQNSTIANNTITGCGSAGIGLFLGYNKTAQTTGVSIVGNTVTNNAHWNLATFIGGITISDGTPSHITLSHNTVTDTQSIKTQAYGIQVRNIVNIPGLTIDRSNQLSGNRLADMVGVNYTSP